MTGRAGEVDGHLIVAYGGGGFDIKDGIEAERIREIDIAAGELIIIAAKRHLAAEQVQVTQNYRTIPGAAQANIAVHVDLRAAPLNARSEERRVGKESRSRWCGAHEKKEY